jgi:hypothetical protein
MMKRISTTSALLLALAGPCNADEAHVDPLDLDEALARQTAADLIDGVTSAYECGMLLRTFRSVGGKESPVYMIEVQASGPECEEALLLLARHGSDRNLLFRRWEPAPDLKEVDPIKRGD